MEKKSGVQSGARSLPATGGNEATGDTFQPNLAMGGGSYKIPFDLPAGPGGYAPKLELIYHTNQGNGAFGQGWSLTLPFIQRHRRSPFAAAGRPEFTLAGAEDLLPVDDDGGYIPAVQHQVQVYRWDGASWTTRLPDLTVLRFGLNPEARIAGVVDEEPAVDQWLLEEAVFPGERTVRYSYDADGSQRYLRRISWSVFYLEFDYEARPDGFSRYGSGFEVATERRCRRISLHQTRLAPDTLIRTWELDYAEAAFTRTSLLQTVRVTGWRTGIDGVAQPTALPPFRFEYSRLEIADRRIQKFRSTVTPPPALDEETTVLDLRGTALPGILRMNGDGSQYWENRGNLLWGPPEDQRALPRSARLTDHNLRFADMTGNGTADLVLADTGGGSYFANDPERGFLPPTELPLTPGFNLDEETTWLVDLDGDRIADLLCFRNGTPIAFFNRQGQSWDGPYVLHAASLAGLQARQPEVRFADMTGNGAPDLVVLTSRHIVYYPALGHGRWGTPRAMDGSPEFDLYQTNTGLYLSDVDGDGLADLILISGQTVQIFFNGGGRFFSEPLQYDRAPRFHPERFVLADMTGSGAAGLLWTAETRSGNRHEYWFLDLLDGLKPNLLVRMENGRGLKTEIRYSTSARERALDLQDGRRWSGYLPFVVQVVKNIVTTEQVTGDAASVEYRYHDGHFDGVGREYLGFASVESFQRTTAQESPCWERTFYHNRHDTATDPAFIAGKGQPHRQETLDPATGEVRQVEESAWQARRLPTRLPDRPGWLTYETARHSIRQHDAVVYARETVAFSVDDIGNVVGEDRTAEWLNDDGTLRSDRLLVRRAFAVHPAYGSTNLQCLLEKSSPDGRLLKHVRYFYDGEAFTGLPFGEVEQGFRTRQTEVALTSSHLAEVYANNRELLTPYYRADYLPEWGDVLVFDTQRCRYDTLGNQLETLDPRGLSMRFRYDPENISPVEYQQADRPARQMTADPVSQQTAVLEDINGNTIRTEYDPFGNVLRVYNRGALPGLPTEEYSYDFSVWPNRKVQRLRINAGDADFGWEKIDFLDGNGRVVQEKVRTESGRYAVGRLEMFTVLGKKIGERDAWFSDSAAHEPVPPGEVAQQRWYYDFAGRIEQQVLYNDTVLRYRYHGNEEWFYSHTDGLAFDADPDHPPTRIVVKNAWNNTVAIKERNGAGWDVSRKAYDALGQLLTATDPLGNVVLEYTYDGWGSVIQSVSADSGRRRFVFDGAQKIVWQDDGDGRSVVLLRDCEGRLSEVRADHPDGLVLERFAYDTGPGQNLAGRLARVDGPFWHVDYSYQVGGKPIRIQWHFDDLAEPLELHFDYNQQNDVTYVRYPDGSEVRYDFAPTGLLAAIPGYIEAIEYNAYGKRTRIQYANGLETRKEWSPGDYLLTELRTQTLDGATRLQRPR